MANNRRAELTDLGRLIISAMHDICVRNKECPTARTPFHSVQIPPMSLHDYAKRIFKYSQCTEECFPFALVLISRYLMRQPEHIKLSFHNSHRLFITALMVSAKLRDDEYYSNAYYSSIGGVSPLEMNALELQFLKDLEWDMYVDPEQFYSLITACEEELFAEKLEHDIKTFRQKREEEKQAAAIAAAQPKVPQRTQLKISKQESCHHAPVVAAEAGESSGGLSSTESTYQPSTVPATRSEQSLSAVSSSENVTMFLSERGAKPPDRTGFSAVTFNDGDGQSGSTRTPTKVHFDPSNMSGATNGRRSRRRNRQ